jgi:hypothetical protein
MAVEMLHYRRLATIVAAGLAVSALSGCGSASGSTLPSAAPPVSAPAAAGSLTPTIAREIATRLWSSREQALSALDATQLSAIETGAAVAGDAAYIRGAQCGCEPHKAEHALVRVVPLIARGARTSFIAQVQTTNNVDGSHPWYVIGLTADATGAWRIGLVTFGWYKPAPPMHALTTADGYTPAVLSRDTLRFVRLAQLGIRYQGGHNSGTSQMSYGATVTSHDLLRPADGIYGLRLASGKEFVCFTVHQIDTYSMATGLAQNDARQQWGALLAPGAYRAIRVDNAESICDVGSRAGANPGSVWLQYQPQVVGTTGTPLGA